MRRQKFTGDGRRPYREAGRRAGVAPDKLLVGINGHGFLADTAEAAVDAFFGPYAEVMSRIGRERGWPPLSRVQFDQGRGQRGHLMVGTPDDAIAKILAQHEVFRHDRYLMQMSVGDQPQAAILRSIELLGHGRRVQSARGTGARRVLAPPLVRDGAKVPEQVG